MVLEAITKSPQVLNMHQVRSWIRSNEGVFLSALTEYGDAIGQGRRQFVTMEDRGKTKAIIGNFSGYSLCSPASWALLLGMREQFGGNIDARVVSSLVERDSPYTWDENPLLMIEHSRLHFKGEHNQEYFIDPTYGQINRVMDRIVIDLVSKESSYYGQTKPPKDVTETCERQLQFPEISLGTNAFERIFKYRAIFASLGVK